MHQELKYSCRETVPPDTRRKLPRYIVNSTYRQQHTLLRAALITIASGLLSVTPALRAQATLLTLPDSPGTVASDSSSALAISPSASGAEAFDPQRPLPTLTRTDKYILPGQVAPQLNAGDKFLLGLKDAVSPLSAVGWLASSGYSHAINSSPHYGTNLGAFGQRLGASVLRATSEGILSDGIMSPLFHEDPRYYKMGRGHNPIKRLVYSATRTIITRTDSGHQTLNLGLLTGNLEGSALTNAYYPQQDRGAKQTLETFAGSIGGSALGFVASEFLSDTLQFVHFKHHD